MNIKALFAGFLLLLILVSGCSASETTSGLPEGIKPFTSSQAQPVSQDVYSRFYQLPVVTREPDPDGIELTGVALGADGAYIAVLFKAPISTQPQWNQGFIYVVDESTHIIYKDIPIMPIIGPLIGRPKLEGKTAYMMFLNYANGITRDSKVSVVIGKYKREHVSVVDDEFNPEAIASN